MLLGVRCIQFQMWWMLYLRPTCMISYEVDLTGVTYSIHGNAHIHGFLIGLLWVSLEGIQGSRFASRWSCDYLPSILAREISQVCA